MGTGTTSELESAPGTAPGVRAQHPRPSSTATAAPLAPRPSKEEVRTVALLPCLIYLGPWSPLPSPLHDLLSPLQPSHCSHAPHLPYPQPPL